MTHDKPSPGFQPRSIFSTWIGVVLLFAFFGLLALVVIGASPRGNTYEEKRAKARAEKLQAMREETTKALATYSWIDKNKGLVRIPITEAMKLTVAELAQKKPVPANPIATPAGPGATVNPPSVPPGAQSGASIAPAAAPPSAAVKAVVSPSGSPSAAALATPMPLRGKTP